MKTTRLDELSSRHELRRGSEEMTSPTKLSKSKTLRSRLTKEEEQDLARRYHTGDEKAGDTLIRDNMRWVVVHAYKMQSSRAPFDDLVEEGNIGLVRALKRFNPDRGLRFMTYATWWIRAMMFHFIIHRSGLVRIPHSVAVEKIFFGRSRGVTAKDCEIPPERI